MFGPTPPGVTALTNTLESGTLRSATGSGRRTAAPKETEPVSTERDRALSTALGQIERSYGKGAIMRLGAADAQRNVEAIPTGALTLDIALGVGGVPRGRVAPASVPTLPMCWSRSGPSRRRRRRRPPR